MCCGTHVTNLSQVQVNGCPSYFVVCKTVKTSLCSSTRRETKKSWEQDCEVLFVTKCWHFSFGSLFLCLFSECYRLVQRDIRSWET